MLEPKKLLPSRIPEIVRAKWSPDVVDEGFTPFPKRLLRCVTRLFVGSRAIEHLAVVLAVVDYRRPNLARPPSLEYLAFLAGMPCDQFNTRVKELEEQGWVTVEGTPESLTVSIDGLLEKIVEETPDEE